jgi:spoIIIJ-associated protein
MEIIEEGKTVEEAITKALQKLNASRDDVKIEIIEKENKGLLKFMGVGKNAKIRASLIEKPDEAAIVSNFINDILKMINIESQAQARIDKDQIHVDIKGDEKSLLYDKGRILESFQHLCNRLVNRGTEGEKIKVIVECGNFRKNQEESLKRLALKLADKARKTGQSQRVQNLSPQNRRIIHITLEHDKDIKTFSKGEGFMKTVIIERVNNKSKFKRKNY